MSGVDPGSSIIEWVRSPRRATYGINGEHKSRGYVEVKRRDRIPDGVVITFEDGRRYKVEVTKL